MYKKRKNYYMYTQPDSLELRESSFNSGKDDNFSLSASSIDTYLEPTNSLQRNEPVYQDVE